MAAVSDGALLRLIHSQSAARMAVASMTVDQVSVMWSAVGGTTSTARARWIEVVVPVVDAGVATMAGVADLHVAEMLGAMTGDEVDPVGLAGEDYLEPRGVPARDVWVRPVTRARDVLAGGGTVPDALRAGALRASQLVDTDLQLGYRNATRDAMLAQPGVVGYRRVPDAKACPFCLLAATRRYRRQDLLPCHTHCHCGVAPIVGDRDPGKVIDRDTLARLKESGFVDDMGMRRAAQRAREGAQRAREHAGALRAEIAGEDDRSRRARLQERISRWDRRAASADARAADLSTELRRRRDERAALGDAGLRARAAQTYTEQVRVTVTDELGPTLAPA